MSTTVSHDPSAPGPKGARHRLARWGLACLVLLTAVAGGVPAAGAAPTGDGYWLLGADGGVFSFGQAGFLGSLGNGRCTQVDPPGRAAGTYQTCSDMAVTRSGAGYWLVDWVCDVTPFGDARTFAESGGSVWRNEAWPECYIEPTPSGNGYWLANSFGGVKAYGDAQWFGDDGNTPSGILDIKATPSGRGYWLIGGDGEVHTYGDAPDLGSVRDDSLNRPATGMAVTPSGRGYWIVATDGGVFTFGDARFQGSAGGRRLNARVWGMAGTPSGNGYWLFALDGGVFTFGDARFHGSVGGRRLNAEVVGLAVH